MAATKQQKKGAPARVSRKKSKNIKKGRAFIESTFNNTRVTFSDDRGNVISWSTAGSMGFKGSRKSTPYAGQVAGEDAARKAMEHGMQEVDVELTGPGSGRESALRAIGNLGMKVLSIKDVTGVPHNGCRQKGRRRV